jgi:hypothetical protein
MGVDVSGSIRKFTIEGIPFRVSADTNVSRKPTNVENDMIPTSGNSMQKKTKVTPKAEGFNLIVNEEEAETIKSFAEGLDIIKVSYETANGSVYRCEGQIEAEAHESEENKMTVTVMPDGDWTSFPA